MSNSIKNWYSLYTRQGCEKKVANLLSRKNIENYCPMKRQWNGRRKPVLEPLFNSYVFVQTSETDLQNIRMLDSVVNFVYWLGKPAIIRQEEIEIIRRFMNEYINVKLEKIPFDMEGVERILAETLSEKANMVSVKNNTVNTIVPYLGYRMFAEVEKSNVEIITSSLQSYTIVDKYKFAI